MQKTLAITIAFIFAFIFYKVVWRRCAVERLIII